MPTRPNAASRASASPDSSSDFHRFPPPRIVFTLPSYGDGTLLSCRLYHPQSFNSHKDPSSRRLHSAAILGHPYAPLGGCQDDHVVEAVGATLLQQDYVVATLDFRGAGHSEGRTSWTAKGECRDYVSVVGFMIYYMHSLNQSRKDASGITPTLIMGGYSFGALVVTIMPDLASIRKLFHSPEAGSHLAQIRLRAETFGQQHGLIKPEHERNTSMGPGSFGVRIGGSEKHQGPVKRRNTFHATEANSRGRLGSILRRRSMSGHGCVPVPSSHAPNLEACSSHQRQSGSNGCIPPLEGLVVPAPAYLLISRPQGTLAHLATMSLLPSCLSHSTVDHQGDEEATNKLIASPSLLVYGDQDGFVSTYRQRNYARKLSQARNSSFKGKEIRGAGHFWLEEGVMLELTGEVNKWMTMDLAGAASHGSI